MAQNLLGARTVDDDHNARGYPRTPISANRPAHSMRSALGLGCLIRPKGDEAFADLRSGADASRTVTLGIAPAPNPTLKLCSAASPRTCRR